jgi:hypothetical protein
MNVGRHELGKLVAYPAAGTPWLDALPWLPWTPPYHGATALSSQLDVWLRRKRTVGGLM